MCQDIENALLEALSTAVVGDRILVPHSSSKVHLASKVTRPALRRWKRSYMDLAKANPTADIKTAGAYFVDYINNQISLI